jgi:hypothetical protein
VAIQKAVRIFFLFLSVVAVAMPVAAQTTGAVLGSVSDEAGGVLPGVTVEARGPSLQGSRLAVSGNSGDYRLSLLPPGEYTVTFTLPGFATETRRSVVVSLDKAAKLDVTLRAAVKEEIIVSGEAPVVDSTSTNLGTNMTTRAIETLPTGRNYSSIVSVAPGTSSDANPLNSQQSTITVYGSSGAENAYIIDGVNTTNVEYGFQGKELNYEFIAEVDVKTGGYEAEYGKSTGGIVNVITKSGGNEFHGDVFGYYDNDSLQASTKSVESATGTVLGFTKKDFGLALGGFIVKDKLWFFAAYDLVKNTTTSELPAGPRAGEAVNTPSQHNLGSGKITWNMFAGHSLVATVFGDPRVDTGAINDANHSLNGDPLTYEGRLDLGGRDFSLRYQGILGTEWAAMAQASRHKEQNSVGPATAAGDAIQYQDTANDFYQTGGFGRIEQKHFERTSYGASLTWFHTRHEIKGGFELETAKADVIKRMSGGQQILKYANLVNPSKPIYNHQYWTTPDATLGNAPVSQLVANPKHDNTTAFLQDRWTLTPNFTVSAGVRWDRQRIIDASGVAQIDLKKDIAPRLGFIWDPTGDSRSKVFGSFGRFYEGLPMDLVVRSYSYERQPNIINYSPTDFHPDPAAEADYGNGSIILGGFTEPSDPNLRGQYLREFIIGGEREVMANVGVGIKGIYRDYGQVIEDFQCSSGGDYCIGNPGQGIMREIYGLNYDQLFPAPRAVRIYRGLQLDVTRRFSNNWQGMASYLYSHIEGNFDGEYAPFTNIGADPNISAAYDYYDFFTNGQDLTRITNRGPLSNDRRQQFKVSGIYMTPFKMSVGLSAYYRTGTPLSRYGYSDVYSRYEFFLDNRGSDGRNPSNYEADVHVGYPLDIGKFSINFLLDVFNLLNAQRAVLLDQRWGFVEADNTSTTPVNPNYGKPVLRTPPTTARLGVRISF